MNVVIVADLDMAEGVNTCVLGYCSEYGWEELDVVPRPLPQKKNAYKFKDFNRLIENAQVEGWNACIDEIMGETE